MRVLVCGSRNTVDHRPTWEALDKLLPAPTLIICGAATGVDRHAAAWAELNGIPCMEFPAPWARYQRAAGPIRNRWMLQFGKPELVLAMPGGKGTQNMIMAATAANVLVRRVGWDV